MKKKESNKAGTPLMPELLAPAGNFEKLVTAIHYGADAVYMGGKEFSLRAKAGNFSHQTMVDAVRYAHAHGVKVYVTVNILAHNRDFAGLDSYLLQLQEAKVDALIIADPGILLRARQCVPGVPVHLSTQANVTNAQAARFWFEQSAGRLNLARELSLTEIREIREEVSGELEVFVHGALCISYSGRCMLSNYMTGRDANQGSCAHPCRYSYSLIEEKRPGEYFPVEEDERGTYIFNSKDLCLLQRLPELVACGVNSLKIEGRMKSIFYVGGVTRIYRAALDYLSSLSPEAWEKPEEIRMPHVFVEEIAKTGTRGISENFISQRPGSSEMLYTSPRAVQQVEPVAVIRVEGASPLVEVRNVLESGSRIEYMLPGIDTIPLTVTLMETEGGEEIVRANPGNRVLLHTDPPLLQGRVNGILRRNRSNDK
ncbi:MAG: U32 family peptidase [Proteobacteria bacterium]|nr:U32 family peptidase [Pseudomonadota bacterium]MBU1231877.1 U32 family peptidase [Pseudomonadota bacterium]MBU1418503.1 U32 family peptidase [Pseudomonadota bacterium]MBU1454874.1 U32 family peptidase [Pseudomonadota bacterium]